MNRRIWKLELYDLRGKELDGSCEFLTMLVGDLRCMSYHKPTPLQAIYPMISMLCGIRRFKTT